MSIDKPGLVDNKLKELLTSLYHYIAPRLKIVSPPRVVFTQDGENAKKTFGLTAYYDHKQRLIRVYITNRHHIDVLRSFCHECVHHAQNERGALPAEQKSHAHYAQKDPVLRQCESEAYLYGNMLYRDWSDSNKYGPIDKNNISSIKKATQSVIKEMLYERLMTPVDILKKEKLKHLIKQRIDEVVKKKNEIPSGMPHGRKNAEGMSYFDIGMIPPYFCWRWSLKDKKILVGKDECHFKHFGKDAYESFRGRYDPQTKKLSITIPDFPKKLITGDLKKDVPLEILKGIKTAFPGCKIHYFPFRT